MSLDRKFKLWLLSGLAVRLLLAGFTFHPWDGYVWRLTCSNLLSGVSPYETEWAASQQLQSMGAYPPAFDGYVYPPFWFYVLGSSFLLYLLTARLIGWPIHMVGLWFPPPDLAWVPVDYMTFFVSDYLFNFYVKLPLIMFDAAIAMTIYRFVHQRWGQDKAFGAFCLYWLNPLTVWISAVWGMFDAIPTFFTFLAVIYLLDGRDRVSAFSLGLGIAAKIYPALLFPVIWGYLKSRGKSWKFILIYTGISGLTLLCLCFPFLLFEPREFLFSVFGSYSNVAGGINFYSALWLLQLHNLATYNAYVTAVTPVARYITVTGLTAFYAYYLKYLDHLRLDKNVAALMMVFYAIGWTAHPSHFLWVLPFLAVFIAIDRTLKSLIAVASGLVLLFAVLDCIPPLFFLPLFKFLNLPGQLILQLFHTRQADMVRLLSLAFAGLAFTGLTLFYIFRYTCRKHHSNAD
jgi:hypothetical protein